MDLSIFVGSAITLFAAFLGILWSATTWISRQFATQTSLVYDKFDQLQKFIVEKIEYHERHDDVRFDAVTKDLWELRMRNAVYDGKVMERESLKSLAQVKEGNRNISGTSGQARTR